MNKMASFTRLEFATLKPYNKSLFMYILILILVGTTNDSLSFTFGMVMIGLPMILSYPFAISEKNNLNILYSTLSLERKEVVTGKYLFVLIIEIIAMAMLLILSIIKSNFVPLDMTFEEICLYLSVFSMISSVFISCQYPMFFKFGYTKARIYTYIPLILIFFLVSFLPSIVERLDINFNWQVINHVFAENINLMILLPIIIGITSLIFSCMISIRIYERKDI